MACTSLRGGAYLLRFGHGDTRRLLPVLSVTVSDTHLLHFGHGEQRAAREILSGARRVEADDEANVLDVVLIVLEGGEEEAGRRRQEGGGRN